MDVGLGNREDFAVSAWRNRDDGACIRRAIDGVLNRLARRYIE
jgi:hypothetical protein